MKILISHQVFFLNFFIYLFCDFFLMGFMIKEGFNVIKKQRPHRFIRGSFGGAQRAWKAAGVCLRVKKIQTKIWKWKERRKWLGRTVQWLSNSAFLRSSIKILCFPSNLFLLTPKQSHYIFHILETNSNFVPKITIKIRTTENSYGKVHLHISHKKISTEINFFTDKILSTDYSFFSPCDLIVT